MKRVRRKNDWTRFVFQWAVAARIGRVYFAVDVSRGEEGKKEEAGMKASATWEKEEKSAERVR
jgi:hypothetical protein